VELVSQGTYHFQTPARDLPRLQDSTVEGAGEGHSGYTVPEIMAVAEKRLEQLRLFRLWVGAMGHKDLSFLEAWPEWNTDVNRMSTQGDM